MKGQKLMHIELKYYNPNTGNTSHFFFPDLEYKTARDYFDDARKCDCVILIWRLVHTSDIKVQAV